jgi:hypothetical protein
MTSSAAAILEELTRYADAARVSAPALGGGYTSGLLTRDTMPRRRAERWRLQTGFRRSWSTTGLPAGDISFGEVM